jgi:GTPase SAR1 family protein
VSFSFFRKSFEGVKHWVDDIKKERGDDSGVILVLVANKCDLEDQREVSRQEAETLASSFNMIYAETSAKTGTGIDELFTSLADKMPMSNNDRPAVVTDGDNNDNDDIFSLFRS